ncbi:MAG: GC-type dockerin domain-anchored protein [Phycisphaerales bacterium]
MTRALTTWMLCFAMLVLTGAQRTFAQCEGWLPGQAVPGVGGIAYATTSWDPDGAGPQSLKIVVGGEFGTAGNVLARNIAAFDTETGEWTSLGTGLGSAVYALGTLPNGDLVAGGEFFLVRWNGSTWSSMVTSVGGGVHSLATMPNGDLIAGGPFSYLNGNNVNQVARWDGETWSSLGTGITAGIVGVVAGLPNGDVIAGGEFGGVRRWNGSAWAPMASTIVTGSVYALATRPNGDVFVGGVMRRPGSGTSGPGVARYDAAAASWTFLGRPGAAANTNVLALAALPDGSVIAGGTTISSVEGVPVSNIARWNGSAWSALATGTDGAVRALAALPNGDVIAAGEFFSAGGLGANRVARWNGSAWAPLGRGLSSPVRALTTLPNGDLVAGGAFVSAGSVAARRIATWNGTDWSPLGAGMDGTTFPAVNALTRLPGGDLIAGGSFLTAGGVAASNIARWTGSDWLPLGSGTNGAVLALTTLQNGDVVAGGTFNRAGGATANFIARWNGAAWTPVGPGMSGAVRALTTLPNGDLIAGGSFVTIGGLTVNHVARWDGSTWSALGPGTNGDVWALLTLPNGDVIAGGFFTTAGGVTANRIARWDGASWSALGDGLGAGPGDYVTAVNALPNGDLIAGGVFTTAGTAAANRIARWSGSAWVQVGSGLQGTAYALTVRRNSELVAGGAFFNAGDIVSCFLARYTLTGVPTLALAPQPRSLEVGQTLELTATPSDGYADVTVRWQRNGVDLLDGPGGASPNGGTVAGATATLPSPTAASSATLTIANAALSDSGEYTAVFSNACGDATSAPATVVIACPADFDLDGAVDGEDLTAYFAAWDVASPAADRNRDGGVDSDDVIVFFARWDAGC